MRRIILIICCLIISGCTSDIKDDQVKMYNRLVDKINTYELNDVTSNIPFNINIYFEKIIDEEITYRVIIDDPKENINKIKAIAIHNYETDNIYPTTDIFEEPLNLIPNIIDLKNNNAKGIILVGYIDYVDDIKTFKGIIKLLVEYEDINGNLKEIYYEYHK